MYKCVHCGDTLPFSKLWFIDNKSHEGICYKKECIAKEEEISNFKFEWQPAEKSWDDLFNQVERS